VFLERSLIALVLFAACSDDLPPAAPEIVLESQKPRVRPKHGERFARDLASALELERSELCRELGRFDCVSEAHRITLGGVEPYRAGIDAPLSVAPVTAPIAYDRVALSACSTRVDRDFDAPGSAALFGPLASADSPAAREATSRMLYTRILRREAEPHEVQALGDLYAEVAAEVEEEPAREWAILSCFAVATTMEGLFY
jgi:hypothetical protein